MYDPMLVQPMREELTRIGFQELTTAEEVDQTIGTGQGTALLVINSVCGCAAGNARPGVKLAIQGAKKPEKLVTVFAGQDREATMKARSYFADIPPSSPSIFLLKDGAVAYALPRHRIEGRSPEAIADDLQKAFEQHC